MNIVNPVILSLFLTVAILAPLSGDAADQLNKMKACNEQANAKGFGEGKGEERKAFMKNVSPPGRPKPARPLSRRK